jgi:cytidylate kinase
MHKLNLSKYIHGKLDESGVKTEPGPYITISREPGCEGYKVGDLLLEMLNKHDPKHRWRIFKKEILHQIAQDTKLAEELIERKLYAGPSIVKEFFRGMSKGGVPDNYEIRSKIANMVRVVAYEGYAIIIGQGGAAATADIPNGLSIRLEAPKKWRLIRVCKRDNLSKEETLIKIEREEEQRAYLRKLYEEAHPHTPAFNLTIDNSILKAERIASLIYYTMQLKNMLPAER